MSGEDVNELLRRHEAKLKQMRSQLEGELEEEHDDIHLLRFLLSHHESVKEAIAWFLRAKKYRKDNESWLKAERPPYDDEVTKVARIHRTCHAKDGSPMLYGCRPGVRMACESIWA